MERKKNPAIDKIWRILKIAEDANNIDKQITWNDLNNYLEILCVQYKSALDNELFELVNGLRLMQIEEQLSHDFIRNIVFNCINIIEKRS